MAYRPLTDIPLSLFGNSSTMLTGGVLRAYVTGTSTPATLYSDADGTSAGTSITLDARGEPTTIKRVWLDTTIAYKLTLEDADGNVLWTADPVTGYGAYSDQYSVVKYGAVGDGVADDTAAFVAALTAGPVYVPAGTFRITSSIVLPSNAKIRGEGVNKSIIQSEVIGDSLFKTSADTIFIVIADMSLEGNSLTGSNGNGHAINFVDPVSAGGSFSPQQAIIERLEISGFRGQDIRTTGVSTTIYAAGVCMYNTLQNICRDVYVSDCGHGFYMATTQNCRLENCAAVNIDKYALLAYDNENLVVDKCDLLAAGDGVVDPGYPSTAYGWDSGVVLSYGNDCFALKNSKLKNIDAGSALVRSIQSFADVYDSNWIRSDAISDVAHKGFYVRSSYNTKITNNEFHPGLSSYPSRGYEHIELYNDSTADTMLTTITGNTFGDVAGQGITYNIKIGGNNTARTHQVIIEGNNFGFNTGRSSATTVAADILIDTCALVASSIKNNLHIAATNVTRTACLSASNITDNRNIIGPSRLIANGGTLTTEYSGIGESVLWGGAIYNPPSMATGTRQTTTVTVTGATLVYPDLQLIVTCGFTQDLQGIRMWGYVSGTDTVTVVFENNTGSTIDLASGGIYVKVEKYGPPTL